MVRREVAIQVSDRHLTLAVPGTPIRDFFANKNVVFAPRYGLVSLGYTGRAYLEHMPTDEWIARRLRPDIEDSGTILFKRYQGRWPDLGEAVAALCHELDRVFGKLRGPEEYFAIVIAGFQWTRRSPRLRRVFWYLSNEGPAGFWIARRPRRWSADPAFEIMEVPTGYLPLDESRLMEQALASASSPDEAEQILTAALARPGARTTAVGPDAMVIRITPSTVPHVRFRFQQATPPRAAIRYLGRDNALAYSPWLLTRDCVWRPAVMAAGKFETYCGGIVVQVTGEDGNYPGLFPQRRTEENGPFRRQPFDWPQSPPTAP